MIILNSRHEQVYNAQMSWHLACLTVKHHLIIVVLDLLCVRIVENLNIELWGFGSEVAGPSTFHGQGVLAVLGGL